MSSEPADARFKPEWMVTPPNVSSLGNTAANFLAGCTGGYNQSQSDPNINMYFNTLEFYATDEWKVNAKLTLTFGIRLSHLPPWMDAHGVGAAVWDPTKYNPVLPHVLDSNMTLDTTTWPGITWHKLDPSVPVSGFASRPLFYSPRLGIAYDLRGDGKTVLRGGWGAYRSRDSFNISGNAVVTSANVTDRILYGNDSCTLDQLMNYYSPAASPTDPPVTGTGSQVVKCGFYSNGTIGFPYNVNTTTATAGLTANVAADDPSDSEQPVTYNYNFTVDRQLPFGSMLEVAYVGNQSAHMATLGNTSNANYSLQNQNAIPLGAFFGPDPLVGGAQSGETIPTQTIGGSSSLANQYRPYPNYAGVFVPHHTNWSNYNALQISLNKQRGALAIGANYTLSKALGVRGNYDTGNTADPVNANHDYGIVSFDRPQAFNITYSYQEGKKFRGNRELGWVLNNWEISGITKLSSGPDLSVLNGSTNYSLSASAGYYTSSSLSSTSSVSIPVGAAEWLGSSDYLLAAQGHLRSAQGTAFCSALWNPNLQASTSMATAWLPAQGTQGAWTLPDVHGPSYFSSDLSIYKDIQMNDRQQIQFRVSGFNFLNHPISSFNNNNLSALDLTFADPSCNTTTGAGCLYSESAALSALTLENAGFGYTPYKFGVRIVEFGVKYNF